MRYLAVLIVLALCMLGCGGSDSDTDSPTTATTSATGGNDTTTTPTTTSQTPTTDDSDDDDDFSPENCPELLQWANDTAAATNAAFAGGGTNSVGFEYTDDYFQEFADRAPSEIRDDIQLFADAFSSFYNTLEELDLDFTDPATLTTMDAAMVQKLEDATELMDTPELEAASARIAAYFERECS